jgi:polyhydroxyalkanoate synthase
VLSNLHDRDFLAQIEAVDNFTDNMHAYPGRTIGQLYHRFFRVNELAGGVSELGEHRIDLADVRVPVLSVAGTTDVLAPRAAVHHVGELLPNAPEVRLKTAPGGHLGVLTGRAAKRTTWAYIDEFLGDTAGTQPAWLPTPSKISSSSTSPTPTRSRSRRSSSSRRRPASPATLR